MRNFINQKIVQLVEEMFINQNSKLQSAEYRKAMPKEEKRQLVENMIRTAIELGAQPVKQT